MKKVILTLAAIALAFAANAQFVIGGDLGITGDAGHHYYNRTTNTTTTEYTVPADCNFGFTFAPKVGYQINENMQAGLGLGFGVTTNRAYDALGYETYEGFEGWDVTTDFSWFVAPYFRYSWNLSDKWSIFVEAQISLGGTPYTKYHHYNNDVTVGNVYIAHELDTTFYGNTRTFNFGIDITPGVTYKFNDHVSADLYIDLAGLSYNMRKSTNIVEAGMTTIENTYVDHDYSLGVLSAARTLNTDLSWFRLGFNYTF